jgi:hypothetical protein
MHSEKKNLLWMMVKKIRLFVILSKVPFYPWNYFFLGKEYLRMDAPLKAARNFTKAGGIMWKKGYKSLTKAAYDEADEIYQNLRKENPDLLEREDYRNMARIRAFFAPLISDKDMLIFCK